jgi:serine/threonine protein kinase
MIQLLKDVEHFAEFEKEAKVLSKIRHPRKLTSLVSCLLTEIDVVSFLGISTNPEKTCKYLVLEYLPKGNSDCDSVC